VLCHKLQFTEYRISFSHCIYELLVPDLKYHVRIDSILTCPASRHYKLYTAGRLKIVGKCGSRNAAGPNIQIYRSSGINRRDGKSGHNDYEKRDALLLLTNR